MGGVSYELLTGEELFRSETVPEKVALVLTNTPDFDRVRRSSAGSSNPVLKGFEAQASTHRRRIASARRRSDFRPLRCRWEARNTANDARIEDQKPAN